MSRSRLCAGAEVVSRIRAHVGSLVSERLDDVRALRIELRLRDQLRVEELLELAEALLCNGQRPRPKDAKGSGQRARGSARGRAGIQAARACVRLGQRFTSPNGGARGTRRSNSGYPGTLALPFPPPPGRALSPAVCSLAAVLAPRAEPVPPPAPSALALPPPRPPRALPSPPAGLDERSKEEEEMRLRREGLRGAGSSPPASPALSPASWPLRSRDPVDMRLRSEGLAAAG